MKKPPARLQTERLVLDQPRQADIARLIAACNIPTIQRVISHPHPYTNVDALNYINWFVPQGWVTGRRYTWTIRALRPETPTTPIHTSLLLGQISLSIVPEDNAATIGYWLHPDAERRGYLTEAAQAVLDQAFDENGLNLERVYWNAYVGNLRSARLAARLGFRYRGRVATKELGWNVQDEAWVALLRAEDSRETQTWSILQD